MDFLSFYLLTHRGQSTRWISYPFLFTQPTSSLLLISIRMFEQNTYISRKLNNLLFRFYKSLGLEKDKSQ